MRITSREDAVKLGGLAVDAWDANMRTKAANAVLAGDVLPTEPAAKTPKDRRSKLEVAFEERARAAFGLGVFYEPIKLRLAGRCFYSPDFLIDTDFDIPTFYEIKGPHRWEDSIIKLKAAADKYGSLFGFVIVTRPEPNRWECREVTAAGISREVWCPSWLK